MPAQLVALTDGPSILLDKPILLFGRHPECDIQIDSRKISRRHCCIAQVSDYLVVRDLGSTNGIRINGVRVLEGRLKSGDELTIGGSRFKVCWDEASAAAVRAEVASRPPVRPDAAVRAEDDELLESCDEPVPLADPPGLLPRAQGHRKVEPPSQVGRLPVAAPANGPPPGPAVPPPILPENLDLAPASDADVKPPHLSG
jgi:predicted component of type VI protein secretion system